MKNNILHKTLILILFLACVTVSAQRAGETYYIQSAIAGKYMDVKSNQTANGTPLHLWRYNGGAAQKFTLENAGGGYFYIKFRSGKYVHVQHGSNQPRVLAHIWNGKNDNAKWRFVPGPNGYFYIQSKKGTYLDVKGGKSADGTPIWLYTLNRGNAQKWKLKKVNNTVVRTFSERLASYPPRPAEKTYYIQSGIAGKYMDVKNNQTANGTPLHLWRYNGGNAQKFTLENAGGGYFYIKFREGKYVHVQHGSNQPRVLAHIWNGKHPENAKWKFIPAGNGYYFIQSKKGTYLDVKGGKSADGTPIWLYTLNRGNAQKWKLKEVSNTSTSATTVNPQILLNNRAIYNYLGNITLGSQGNSPKPAKGPDLDKEPLPVFTNLEAELSDRFDPNSSKQYSRISANLIKDKESASGVYYYLPNSYHLEWDKDLHQHKLHVDYGKNSDARENKSTRVQATLTSGITLKEIRFIEDMLKKIIRDIDPSITNPKVKLRPLPVENPRIEFSGGGFDISEDQISTIGFSDFEHPFEVVFTTSDDNIDALKSSVLQNGLSSTLHFSSKHKKEDESKEIYDIPAKIGIMDKQSYGVLEVNLESLSEFTNPIPFPILVKYLHVLTPSKTSEGIKPVIYSFDLGSKEVQPKDILKFTKPAGFRVPGDISPVRAFIDYSILECDPCSQNIITELTGGLSSATKKKVTFRSLDIIESTGAAFIWIDLKSIQLDPGKKKVIETSDPLEISTDNELQISPSLYIYDSEKLTFKYKVTIVMPDGQRYEMNRWLQGDQQKIALGSAGLKKYFSEWPASVQSDEDETEN